MLPENLLFLSAQPHDLYFQWQIEVQITNFRKFGISERMYILVWYPEGSPHIAAWQEIQKKYSEVHIFLYQDKGVDTGLYISQLRPHILAQFFTEYKDYLADKQFFYHDSDILFNWLPDFEKLCADDIVWQSDTSSYLDYDYLVAKEQEGKMPEGTIVNKMAEIGKVSPDVIKEYNRKTGGAQHIFKKGHLTGEYWKDVEQQCKDIRLAFTHKDKYPKNKKSINTTYFKTEEAGLQSWCADMWAVNFALWNRGIQTDVTKDLEFSWGTDSFENYMKKPIFHNAGVTKTEPGVFYKGAWINKSPIGQKFELDSTKASSVYMKAIMDVK